MLIQCVADVKSSLSFDFLKILGPLSINAFLMKKRLIICLIIKRL
jgi:hypothetical protein